jgi:uncharacterized protein (DUF302 family)
MDGPGLITVSSPYSVVETIDTLKSTLESMGLKIFARIDHAGEAERAGLSMRPTQLLIFGSPTAGTPVMVAAPTSAIDLPLKVLAWQDAAGKVWISYNRPEYLAHRHGIPEELLKNIAGVGPIIDKTFK